VKFRVERDVLADAVSWAARTLPTRPSMPVLAGLVLEAHEDSVTLSSFDYEVSSTSDYRRRCANTRNKLGVRSSPRRHHALPPRCPCSVVE
jgi:hypothetical protein